MIRPLRRLVWYEPGEGFAERGWARGYPVALLRIHGAFALTVTLLMAAFIGIVFTPLRSHLGAFAAPFPVLILIVPLLVFGPRLRRVKRFMKREVVEAGGLVCPRCLYDLRGSGEINRCPECGQPVDLDTLPRQWARTVRALRYPKGDREAVRGWRDV